MKRAATTLPDEECDGVLLKALRRSVSGLLEQKRIATAPISNDRAAGNSTRLADDTEAWMKYWDRLSSFTITSQLRRPKELTPVVFAKHGWQYGGEENEELVRCGDCSSVLSVHLQPPTVISARVYSASIRNIQRKLTEAHDLNCKWRSKEMCIAEVYDIRQRYQQFEAAGTNEVPLDEDSLKRHWPEGKAVIRDCARNFAMNRFRLLSAIGGWVPSSENRDEMLCRLCGRRLCLLVFSDENPFDPLDAQHHSYCPVIDSAFPLWRESLERLKIGGQQHEEKQSLGGRVSVIKSLLRGITGKKRD